MDEKPTPDVARLIARSRAAQSDPMWWIAFARDARTALGWQAHQLEQAREIFARIKEARHYSNSDTHAANRMFAIANRALVDMAANPKPAKDG